MPRSNRGNRTDSSDSIESDSAIESELMHVNNASPIVRKEVPKQDSVALELQRAGYHGGYSLPLQYERKSSKSSRLDCLEVRPLRDIRDLRDDPVEYAAELQRRWGGLLSYRYIGRKYSSMDFGEVDNTVTLRHDMRNATGGLLVAPLSISSPEGAVGSDRETVPNPVVHSCQILDPARDVRRIEVIESESLHQGTRLGYSRSKIIDADDPDRVIAFTQGQGVKLGEVPDGLERMPPNPLDIVDSPDLPPLWQVFGSQKRADGHWALPELMVELASPDAALHIGPQHVLLETAGIDLAAALVGTTRLQMRTWHVMFLARGKVGPFRSDGEAVRGGGSTVGVRLSLFDEGNGDRMITAASAVFEIVV